MFDWKKPTVQMLGRWQPWHEGHRALFERCISKTTGQVIIQVRDVQGASGGTGQDDNPFDWDVVCSNIEKGLNEYGIISVATSLNMIQLCLYLMLLILLMVEVLDIHLKRKYLITL